MSQCEALLARLQRGEVVTPKVAYEITGSLACHSRIAELREQGHHIICTIKRNGRSKWGEYRLIGQAELAL